MSKFKIRLKVTGLEVEIEGVRDDIPLIVDGVKQQLGGLLGPASAIVEGEFASEMVPAPSLQIAQEPRQKRKSRVSRAANTGFGEAKARDWKHNPSAWGTPLQSWNTADKAIWLLHVVESEVSEKDLTGPEIAATFNKHFRQARAVHPPNVTRDLGKLKSKAGAKVGEDTTKNPSRWFLTDLGKKRAVELVSEALGKTGDV